MTTPNTDYKPGQKVRVTQQVLRLERPGGGTMVTAIEGVIVRTYQSKTGSWFAHSKDKKLWLDRLELRKESGELVIVNLDQNSSIEVLAESAN
jgi:hypothetical protein